MLEAGDLRCRHTHYDVIVMQPPFTKIGLKITNLNSNLNLPGANELIIMQC